MFLLQCCSTIWHKRSHLFKSCPALIIIFTTFIHVLSLLRCSSTRKATGRMMEAFMTASAPLCSKPHSWLGGSTPQKQAHWPHAHVSFVFLPINDAQQGGSLLVLKVKSHVIHGFYWKTKKTSSLTSRDAWRVCSGVSVLRCERTCALQTVQRGGESFGPGQQVVFELGEAFALCDLHADLMLLLCEASALAIQQELQRPKESVTHQDQSQMSGVTSPLMSYVKLNHWVSMNHHANVLSAGSYPRGFFCR